MVRQALAAENLLSALWPGDQIVVKSLIPNYGNLPDKGRIRERVQRDDVYFQ
jgi:hypothetical protein